MRICFLLFMFFYGTTFCRAQLEDILTQFDAVQTDNKIQLIFTIKAGNTCNGIQIYRSPDSLTFAEIGDIQGICGSSGRDESYSFTDNSPVGNKMNYYRLQLGTLGYSFIAKLFFIQPDGNKALLFPNPLTGETVITFLNTSREEVRLSVYNSTGISIYNSDPTNENKFWLNKDDYSPGLYFFNIISDGQPLFNGKFTVL